MTTPREPLLRPVRGIIPAALLGGLSTAAGVALTATSGWLIVRADERPYILALMVAIVGVRTFGIGRPVLRYAERLFSHNAALADLARRRAGVYRALVPLTPARLGRRGRSQVLTGVVRDLDDEVDAQLRVSVPLLGSAITAALAIIAAAALLPAAGVVLAAMTVVALVICGIDYALETAGQRESLAARGEVADAVTMATSQALELRAIGAAPLASARLDAAQARLERATVRQARGRAVGHALATALVGATTIAMALVVVPEVRAGAMVAPIAALLALLPVALNDALIALPDALGAWARSRSAHDRVTALLDQAPAVTDPSRIDNAPVEPARGAGAPHEDPAVDLAHVSAGWVEGREDLAPTDVALAPGERLAVVGPNGSGKSTLLAILARHLEPATGTYRRHGLDVATRSLDEVRARIAVMDDEPHVFASTLRENLRLAAPDADDETLVAALRTAGLGTWFDADLADGLDTRLGAGGRGISGGERARLALARVLLTDRDLVLLDEPVAHLDHATSTEVLGDVFSSLEGRTVVVISHKDDGLDSVERTLTLG